MHLTPDFLGHILTAKARCRPLVHGRLLCGQNDHAGKSAETSSKTAIYTSFGSIKKCVKQICMKCLHSILLLFRLQSLCGCTIPCSDHVRLNTVNAECIVVTSKIATDFYLICRGAIFRVAIRKHRKITEIEYKTENMENRGKQRFCNPNTYKQKYFQNHCF